MVLLYYLRNILKPEIYGPGYLGMLKQGIYEAPYITGLLIMLPLPFAFLPYVLHRYDTLDGEKRRYVFRYTVFRPDDPKLKHFMHSVDRTKTPQQ